jgi:hypothetical protein
MRKDGRKDSQTLDRLMTHSEISKDVHHPSFSSRPITKTTMMVCMTTRRQTALLLLAFLSLLAQVSSFTISSIGSLATTGQSHVSTLPCRFPTQLALAAAAKADDESLSNEALKAELSKYLLKRKEENADEAAQK